MGRDDGWCAMSRPRFAGTSSGFAGVREWVGGRSGPGSSPGSAGGVWVGFFESRGESFVSVLVFLVCDVGNDLIDA